MCKIYRIQSEPVNQEWKSNYQLIVHELPSYFGVVLPFPNFVSDINNWQNSTDESDENELIFTWLYTYVVLWTVKHFIPQQEMEYFV